MKIKNYAVLLLLLVLGFTSCNKDDDDSSSTTPPRDRGEQYITDLDSLERFLETHFYNYEEFQADPTSTDFEIVIDTIEGVNMDKTPLIDQVDFKMVTDLFDDDVEYKLYYLKVREGVGDQPTFADSTLVNYKGNNIYGDVFDSTVNPTWLKLFQMLHGFRETVSEFKSATDHELNPDGTSTFHDYGIGAMFLPSGLAYFDQPRSFPTYSPLIFTFDLYKVNQSDEDKDGMLNYYEDLDGNRDLYDDDTDDDSVPNFLDLDDDGDGLPTKDELDFNEYVINIGDNDPVFAANELEIDREVDENAGTITIDTVVVLDSNDDGTPDYLDKDTTIED